MTIYHQVIVLILALCLNKVGLAVEENCDTKAPLELTDLAHHLSCNPALPTGQVPIINGKLTPFWAQEYIGADLAKEFTIKEGGNAVKVGIIDGGFWKRFMTAKVSTDVVTTRNRAVTQERPDHGTAVANLLAGESPYGVSAKGEFKLLAFGDYDNSFADTAEAVEAARPVIVNMSMDEEAQGLVIQKLFEKNLERIHSSTLLVHASGNHYPGGMSYSSKDKVTVGSLSPYGVVSEFSVEDPTIAVLAPSDHWIQVAIDEKGVSRFGGTSGAAPLVSGALANALSFLGSLTPDEANLLLKRTSLKGHWKGPGMLNAYHLVRVAKRLKEQGWPKDKDRLLQDPSIFDFKKESQLELSKGLKLLKSSSCANRKKGFHKLRKVFLLSQSPKAAEILARIYEKNGLNTNASFYAAMTPAGFAESLKTLSQSQDPRDRMAALRVFYDQDNLSGLESGLLDKDAKVKSRAQDLINLMKKPQSITSSKEGKKSEQLILNSIRQALKSKDGGERMNALLSIPFTEDSQTQEILLKSLKTDSSPAVRGTAAYMARHLRENALPLLDLAIKDKSFHVRGETLYAAASVGEAAMGIVEIGYSDENPAIRTQAIRTAGAIGGKRGRALVSQALTSPVLQTDLTTTIFTIGRMGKDGAELLKIARTVVRERKDEKLIQEYNAACKKIWREGHETGSCSLN